MIFLPMARSRKGFPAWTLLIASSLHSTLPTRRRSMASSTPSASRMNPVPAGFCNSGAMRAFRLGTTSYSHMDLDTNSLEAFEKDILANEATLQKYGAGEDWHWFRFPYLHEGDTAAKHQGIEAFLKEHGYKVAEVTLSFNDYAYNEPYARCLAKHDAPAIEQLKQSYMAGAAESLILGRKISDQLYHRDTKYIMLLHVGGFQTVMLPKLLDLLKQQNFQLITLPVAAADPIYNEDPALAGHWDNLFSQQVMQAHHLNPSRPIRKRARQAE